MSSWKKFISVLLWCFATLLLIAQFAYRLGAENEPIVCIIGFVIMLLSSVAAYKIIKQPTFTTFLSFMISFFFLDLFIRFMEGFSNGYFSLFRLIYEPLGICVGYLLFTRRWRLAVFITSFIAIVTYVFQVYYIKPYIHFLNFHNATGLTARPEPATWIMQTPNGTVITNKELQGKTVLLDFWYTSCAVCFKKFPSLQQLYDSLGHRNDLVFYAVNIPWRNDTPGLATHLIKKRGYTFPVTIGNLSLASSFGVEVYPTLVVIKNQRIVFFGDIDALKKRLPDILK